MIVAIDSNACRKIKFPQSSREWGELDMVGHLESQLLRRLRQEDLKLGVSRDNLARSCFQNKKQSVRPEPWPRIHTGLGRSPGAEKRGKLEAEW